MRFVKELITPEIAAKYLETNVSNRKYRKHVAQDYAQEILNNEWEPDTGENIKFNVKGQMFDGQHRLNAIIIADKAIYVWVVYDAPESAFAKIDSGLKRTSGDVLQIAGAKSSLQVAGIIRKYLLLKAGRGYGSIGGSQSRGIHNHDVLAEYKRRKRYWDACNEQTNLWYGEIARALAPSDIGGFYAYLSEVHGDDASRFFTKLCSGTDLGKKSPIRHLRSFLINSKYGSINGRKIRKTDRSAMLIKTWNLFRKNQSVEKLSFNPQKEEFPIPV